MYFPEHIIVKSINPDCLPENLSVIVSNLGYRVCNNCKTTFVLCYIFIYNLGTHGLVFYLNLLLSLIKHRVIPVAFRLKWGLAKHFYNSRSCIHRRLICQALICLSEHLKFSLHELLVHKECLIHSVVILKLLVWDT